MLERIPETFGRWRHFEQGVGEDAIRAFVDTNRPERRLSSASSSCVWPSRRELVRRSRRRARVSALRRAASATASKVGLLCGRATEYCHPPARGSGFPAVAEKDEARMDAMIVQAAEKRKLFFVYYIVK